MTLLKHLLRLKYHNEILPTFLQFYVCLWEQKCNLISFFDIGRLLSSVSPIKINLKIMSEKLVVYGSDHENFMPAYDGRAAEM